MTQNGTTERMNVLEATLNIAYEALVQIAGKRDYADDPWQIARNALREIGACPNCGGQNTSTHDGACVDCGSEK
jgi:hypothetical protein